jgi:predicted hydrocarbon binding protein
MKRVFVLLFSSPAFVTLCLIASLTLGATFVFMALEQWDFLHALIFTLTTVTTIGYGTIYPETHRGEVFTAWLMILSLAVVVATLSTFAARLIHMVARGANPMEENEKIIAVLKDHVLVLADGTLAPLLIEDMKARSVPFVALTRDEAQHARWLEERVPTLLGDPDDEELLHRAGVARAAGLIVALESDADNVFVSLSAHDLNPKIRIVARAHAASSIPKLRRSGANEVILPDEITAINLASSFRDKGHIAKAVETVTAELREALTLSESAAETCPNPPRDVLFRAIRLALQDLGPGMDDMLYALGRQFGREAVGPNLVGNDLCSALLELPRLWRLAGLGKINITDCREDLAHIEEDECATCGTMLQVGRPVCHLERGVIAGALEARLGRTVSTRETKCWGTGAGACEFEVTVDLDVHS